MALRHRQGRWPVDFVMLLNEVLWSLQILSGALLGTHTRYVMMQAQFILVSASHGFGHTDSGFLMGLCPLVPQYYMVGSITVAPIWR